MPFTCRIHAIYTGIMTYVGRMQALVR